MVLAKQIPNINFVQLFRAFLRKHGAKGYVILREFVMKSTAAFSHRL